MTNSQGRGMPIVRTVVWFAMVAGLLEAGFLLTKWMVFQQFTWTSVHAIWMAPIANAVLLLIPGILLGALALKRPEWVSLPRIAGILTFGAAAGMILVVSNGALASWAIVLLALGIGLQAGRLIQRHQAGFAQLIRRTTPWIAVLVLLTAAALPGWMIVRERIALKNLPAASNAPNVLLIILDTVRSASLSLYDSSQAATPNLQRWAKGGTVFDMAQSTAPWTLPSHASMFTGRWPHELTAGWKTPLRSEFPTLAEILRDRGYVTAGFVANHYYTTRQSGLNHGFIYYDDIPITPVEILRSSLLGQFTVAMAGRGRYKYLPERSTERRNAGEISRSFLAWLAEHESRPWFAFLNFFDAHKPYRVPEWFSDHQAAGSDPLHAYEHTLEFLDYEIGLMLERLEREGMLDNTLIVITSDHGEQFGRHGVNGHGNTLYRTATTVPLIIRYPARVPQGRRVTHPVSLRDLPQTILDLIQSPHPGIPGQSLSRTWLTQGASDTVLTELLEELPDVKDDGIHAPMHSLMTTDLHYIRQANGTEEIYDMIRDPGQTVNLADSAVGASALPRFRAALAARIRQGS